MKICLLRTLVLDKRINIDDGLFRALLSQCLVKTTYNLSRLVHSTGKIYYLLLKFCHWRYAKTLEILKVLIECKPVEVCPYFGAF